LRVFDYDSKCTWVAIKGHINNLSYSAHVKILEYIKRNSREIGGGGGFEQARLKSANLGSILDWCLDC
jgi:hypothetical protein